MGCGASRIDANGTAIPARLRPIFLQRLEDIRTRRYINRPFHAPSKKVLLLGDTDEHGNDSPKALETYKEEGKENYKRNIASKEISTSIGIIQNDPKESKIKDDDKYCKERMIGHVDDDAFPGSPSFRVYFKENGEDDDHINNSAVIYAGKYDAFVSSDEGMSPKESSYNVVEKKNEVLKSGRKKRSFKKVMLPKGGGQQVKNLLNVKLCYTPSTITPKTPS